MNTDLINKYIKQSPDLNKKSLDELKELLNKFPYFQTAHLLYIYTAKNINDKNLNEIIGKSSAFISNREILYNLLSGNISTSGSNKKTEPKKTVLRENTKVTIKSVGKTTDKDKSNIKTIPVTEKEDKTSELKNKTSKNKEISKESSENDKNGLTEIGLKKHEVLLDEIFKPKIKKKDSDLIISDTSHFSESDAIAIPKKDKNKKKVEVKTKSKDSLTDDIFSKIADIKKDKIKVKSAGEIFKTKQEEKKSEEKEKPEIKKTPDKSQLTEKEDVKEKINAVDNIVKKPTEKKKKEPVKKEEIKEITKETEIKKEESSQLTAAELIRMHKNKSSERKPRKRRTTERPPINKEETINKESESKETYSINKEFSETKPELTVSEEEKNKEKEELKVKAEAEKKEETKIKKETSFDKTAADSIYDKIARFKKKREEEKEENKEKNKDLIEKFIENEPRLDRTKEPEIEGDVSDDSTIEKEPIITELMANIYINQNHFDKAIDIFKKLILKYPKKKDYFAAKIEEVENMK